MLKCADDSSHTKSTPPIISTLKGGEKLVFLLLKQLCVKLSPPTVLQLLVQIHPCYFNNPAFKKIPLLFQQSQIEYLVLY